LISPSSWLTRNSTEKMKQLSLALKLLDTSTQYLSCDHIDD